MSQPFIISHWFVEVTLHSANFCSQKSSPQGGIPVCKGSLDAIGFAGTFRYPLDTVCQISGLLAVGLSVKFEPAHFKKYLEIIIWDLLLEKSGIYLDNTWKSDSHLQEKRTDFSTFINVALQLVAFSGRISKQSSKWSVRLNGKSRSFFKDQKGWITHQLHLVRDKEYHLLSVLWNNMYIFIFKFLYVNS